MKFYTEGLFKYTFVLVYLFLFYQSERFCFPLQKMDSYENPQPVIHRTSLVRKNTTGFTFSDFVDQYLYVSYLLLINDVEPRIGPEIRKILHLSEQTRTRDWYLYQNYT